MNWIDRLERKYRRFAITGLVKYLVIGTAIVFALEQFKISSQIINKLVLFMPDVLRGQIWRLVTFIFIPPETNPIFIIFILYMFYMFGKALEEYWGNFRFNLYYLIGMIGAIISACIIPEGYGNTEFLSLSIFLAFAYIYPEFKILLFFVIPVKVKYLAWVDLILIVFSVLLGSASDKVAAIMSFLNFIVFFGKDMYDKWIAPRVKKYIKKKRHSKFKVIVPDKTYEFVHKCSVCGRTSKSHPFLKFGYCPSCTSDFEYCNEHLKDHEHFLN